MVKGDLIAIGVQKWKGISPRPWSMDRYNGGGKNPEIIINVREEEEDDDLIHWLTIRISKNDFSLDHLKIKIYTHVYV